MLSRVGQCAQHLSKVPHIKYRLNVFALPLLEIVGIFALHVFVLGTTKMGLLSKDVLTRTAKLRMLTLEMTQQTGQQPQLAEGERPFIFGAIYAIIK